MSEGTFGKAPNDSKNQLVRFYPTQESSLVYIKTPDGEKVYFYVNPNSWNMNYKPKITRRRSHAGWIDELWGEELDSIGVEAVSGGFQTESTGFASFSDSKTSDAFTRLEKIVQAYRSGGITIDNNFAKDFIPLELHFDRFIYYGFFESLSLEDSVDKPFMLSFSFTFKVLGTDVTF